MEAKTKKLMFGLIAMIMLLSIIPLAFLGSGNQIDVPDIEPEDLVLTGSGEFDAKIDHMNPILIFSGIRESNDPSEVIELINSIGYVDCTENNKNCTINVGLNPYGVGHIYIISIKLKNISDSEYVGYRISYRLNSVLNTNYQLFKKFTVVPSIVSLSGSFDTGELIVKAKNITTNAQVSYSNSINDTIKVKCDDITYSKQGVLINANNCIDVTDYPNEFGLSLESLIENYNFVNKSIELDLEFEDIYFEAEGNFTDSLLAEKLDFAEVSFSSDNSTAEISFTDNSKISEVENALKNYEIIDSYKRATVQLPDSVELEKEYDIVGGLVDLQFPVTQPSGKQMVKLQFSVIFDEVSSVKVV